jgi:DNA mismatch repair protein MutL
MAMLDKRLRRMEERIIKVIPKHEQEAATASVTRAVVKPSIPGSLSGASFPSRWQPQVQNDGSGQRFTTPVQSWGSLSNLRGEPSSLTPRDEPSSVNPRDEPPVQVPSVRPMIALGQFRDTFIIAVDDEGIAIVDQHVAHERVLFERMTERLTNGRLDSQRLLVPLLVELPTDGRQALVTHAADLERLGFEIEEFGGGALRVVALPALLRHLL